MSGFGVVRTIALAIAILMIAIGIVSLTAGGPGLAVVGLWNVVLGLVLLAAIFLERRRYRSEPGERLGEPPGRGGGEPHGTVLEARFRPTDETFEDPTTRHRMRVWLDAATGERRYLHED
jgi:hypothetical protein